MTYGELKLRFVKAFPGVDVELIEGWIGDVLADILHELPWQRQNATSVLQTVAPYSTGTITLTAGSNSVTGSGTTFSALMTGRALRVTGRNEIYEFTQVSPTTGTLDRGYEGTSSAGLSYSIFQHVYVLPADCRLMEDTAFLPCMKRLSVSQLGPPSSAGKPNAWASYMDDSSTPPRMQVRLDSIPDAVYGFPFTYQAETPNPSGTSVTMLPWIQPGALVEGVTAKIQAHMKDFAAAAYHSSMANAALERMRAAEAHGMAPTSMQLSGHYINHRRRRWQ